jgi:pimeloyl-ACP methyl ester carboxylesterase
VTEPDACVQPVPTTRTLAVPGAVLHYDVRAVESSDHPVLLLVGSPMGAAGFAALAGYFTDRTVVTYDPRGCERSRRTDGAAESSPDEHADDLYRLIETLDAAPVDVFASSGGAVNALVLVARHPERVRTLVAHEAPVLRELPDHEPALAATADIRETYRRDGLGPAMAKFFALYSHEGPIPADFTGRPAPDPARLGLPVEDDGSRDDPLVAQNMVTCTHYRHDFDALRAASTRVVLAMGAESGQVIPGRTTVAMAERLGTTPVIFVGGHQAFLGEEYGMTGAPDAFAARLREVL